jgi:hypothetical protein
MELACLAALGRGDGRARNSPARVGNTDHLSFRAIELPGFNPLQDYADYDVRTHHANMDTFERVQEADMKQAAIGFASFARQAATRDARFPPADRRGLAVTPAC